MIAAALALIGAMLVAPAVAVAAPAESSVGAVDQALGSPVKMADLSKFRPGNIISDQEFFNRGSMSEAQIQQFLQSKVPTCRAGYTCLKDWYDTSRTTAADAMCGAYPGGVRERASTIIFKVAQACGINPQVILATLQKEQSLVDHTSPSTSRFTIAMGQGCPDTAACDTRYYGFFNQVYGAAWQFKRYANPPGTSQYFTWYAPGRTWNIRYDPDANCGSSPVFIENQATANLYYYTPYQPNANAIRAGYADSGDPCSSYGNRNFYHYYNDWFGASAVAANSPFGNIELVQAGPGQFNVSGWVADPNTTEPLSVHVYIGPSSYAITANHDRADVAAAYPGTGLKHGFAGTFPANASGTVSVCIYAINAGPGANVLVGCRSVEAMSGSPVGSLESATGVVGGVQVKGWAIDPDTADPTSVHVYIDSVGTGVAANKARPDIAAQHPAYGANHGFEATLPASPGPHTVCAYGINVSVGGLVQFPCRTVTVPGVVDLGRAPIGNLESVALNGNVATAAGWAIDPDTNASIKVHLYVGSLSREYTADKARADVEAANPGYGPNHGFSEQLTIPVGTTSVCAYGINTGAGGHSFLGCRTVTVAAPIVDRGRAPFGNLEAVVPVAGGANVSGWAIDPDTTEPIAVHIYVDATSAAYVANKSRDDVAAAYPGFGNAHGFGEFVAMTSGTHTVCVYPINNASGGNAWVGCRTITVP